MPRADDMKAEMNEGVRTIPEGAMLNDQYRLLVEEGDQGIGVTYRAVDTLDERPVVVLLLSQRYKAGEDLLARLSGLQKAVADLGGGTVVPFERVGLAHGRLFLVHEHVDAPSLGDILRRERVLASAAALRIAVGLSDSLAAVHEAGLVHGSLSPETILVSGEGPVVITDTGLLPALRPLSPLPGQAWGRFPYISPEQAAGEDALPASDVYAVGLLLYEMLSGRPPFGYADASSVAMQHLRREPIPLQSLAAQVPLPLAQVVHKALAKEPAARYRNAGQLAHILRSLLEPKPAHTNPEPTSPHTVPPVQRLIVPPPPALYPEGHYNAAPYRPRIDDWQEEPEGVDWLMIGLIIAALLAALGLIPLWRTVYRRYAVESPRPSSLLMHWLDQDKLLVRWDPEGESMRPAGREDARMTGRSQDWPVLPAPSRQPNTRYVALRLSTALRCVQNSLQGLSGTG
jgi:serine/threonine protein kinase